MAVCARVTGRGKVGGFAANFGRCFDRMPGVRLLAREVVDRTHYPGGKAPVNEEQSGV